MSQLDLIRVSANGPGFEKSISFSSEDFNTIHTARQIATHLSEIINNESADPQQDRCLNIDFRDIETISSAGLNQLIGINSEARNSGIRLVLLNVHDSVRDVFVLTRLEQLFEFGTSPTTPE